MTKKQGGYSTASLLFSLLCVISLALVIKNTALAADAMKNALKLSAEVLIPSLFPFMAISDIVLRCGGISKLGRLLERPMRTLFGVGGESGSALLLGFLCGFPLGTLSSVTLYRENRINKQELGRLLCFSNVPSSAFVINAIGSGLFGDRRLGVALYAVTLISALIVGIGINLFSKKENKKGEPALSPKKYQTAKKRTDGAVSLVTSAVSDAALGMLKVCAFVAFFGTLVGTLSPLLDALKLSQIAKAVVYGAFELTGGVSAASKLPSEIAAATLAAAFTGWSGLSVHLQIISLCPKGEVSFKPYFLSKLCQGILGAAIMLSICLK